MDLVQRYLMSRQLSNGKIMRKFRRANPTDVILLNMCIYQLVQAAGQYHKNSAHQHIFKNKIGFEGGDIDPCLCYASKNIIVFVAIDVVGDLVVRNEAAIDETIESLWKEGFILTINGNIEENLL